MDSTIKVIFNNTREPNSVPSPNKFWGSIGFELIIKPIMEIFSLWVQIPSVPLIFRNRKIPNMKNIFYHVHGNIGHDNICSHRLMVRTCGFRPQNIGSTPVENANF